MARNIVQWTTDANHLQLQSTIQVQCHYWLNINSIWPQHNPPIQTTFAQTSNTLHLSEWISRPVEWNRSRLLFCFTAKYPARPHKKNNTIDLKCRTAKRTYSHYSHLCHQAAVVWPAEVMQFRWRHYKDCGHIFLKTGTLRCLLLPWQQIFCISLKRNFKEISWSF